VVLLYLGKGAADEVQTLQGDLKDAVRTFWTLDLAPQVLSRQACHSPPLRFSEEDAQQIRVELSAAADPRDPFGCG
jgi:hypothetical protein